MGAEHVIDRLFATTDFVEAKVASPIFKWRLKRGKLLLEM